MSGDKLVEAIQEVIEQTLRDSPIFVWYDEGSTLVDVIPKAIPQEVNFLRFSGSYLSIRATIEREDPEFKQKWLIYIPEKTLDPSWIRDYELFGRSLDLTIERLLAKSFGLKSSKQTREILSGYGGHVLAAHWDDVIGDIEPPITQEKITRGLLSAVFGMGSGFNLGRAILQYVTHPDRYQTELARTGLHGVFAETIRKDLGFHKLPEEKSAEPEKLAAALLFSELAVRSGGLGAKEFEELLPAKRERTQWANLVDEWIQNNHLVGEFIRWSNELEEKYDIRSKLTGLDKLINVSSFASVDEALLDELIARVEGDGVKGFYKHVNTILSVAEQRRDIIWAKTGKIKFWDAIHAAAKLYLKTRDEMNILGNLPGDSLEAYIERYLAEDGWWQIDDLYRALTSNEAELEERIITNFVNPACSAYGEWLRKQAMQTSDAIEKSSWSTKIAINQANFWDKIVGVSGETIGILLIDALRYDLSKQLAQRLRDKGFKLLFQPMLTLLPSITEVGMSALLPRQGKELSIGVSKGELNVSLGGEIPLTSKNDRLSWLGKAIGKGVKILELDELIDIPKSKLESTIKGAKRIVITSREIDRAGTFLSDISVSFFNQLIDRIVKIVSKLHEAGIEKVVIGTDHGFLLLPKGFEIDLTENVPAKVDIVRGRRYALGKPPKIASFLSFPLSSLGLHGDTLSLFPRGIACIPLPGETGVFLHGGTSLQETCVATIASISKGEVPEKVDVKAQVPETISTAVFFIELSPVIRKISAMPRSVKVEAYDREEKIAESETLSVQHHKVKAHLILRKIPKEIEIRIRDTESDEIFLVKTVSVNLEGYDEGI